MSKNTVPMLVADAMTREGLSEADTVWDADADSVAVSLTLLGFSVRNRAGRFDFIEADGTLHPRGYKTRGPVTTWARKRVAQTAPVRPVAEAAPVDVIPDPVADAQEAQDATDAEAFRVKATRAHDRVVKGYKRVMAARELAQAAKTRAEAARERAEAAEAAESERAYARVAEADALMWSHVPGAADYRHAFGAFVSARFDAEFLLVSDACTEVYAYAEAAEAAAGAEYENGDGKDVPGADQCAQDADHARKETMIEYGVFEHGTPASRFDAETACDLICLHARDMAAAVRHAEAAAKAVESAADQSEAWADTVEEQTDAAAYETDALFSLGAEDAQRALSRAFWGVSDVVAEAVEQAAEIAPEAVECAAPRGVVTVAASVAAEAGWPAVMLPAGVARWDSQEAEGAPVTVAGPRGEVQVWYAGYWDVCWGHCPTQHAHNGGTCGCAHVLRPVMLCDGESESYTWQDCPECMARELKADADTVWAVAPEGARAAVLRASVVAESWYVAEDWNGGRTPEGANLDARETAAAAVADVEASVRALMSNPGATGAELETSLREVRAAAGVVESWADHVWEADRENARRAEAALRQTSAVEAAQEMSTCTELVADGTPMHPDVVSDPGTVDVWEGVGGAMLSGAHGSSAPVGRPGPYGSRLVTKAESAARARAKGDALRPELEARAFVARERLAWLTDMRDLAWEACERGVAGVFPETARAWYRHAQEVAQGAAYAADAVATEVERYEWEAQRYEDDAEQSARDVARARSSLARMTAGDVPASHGVWLSVDGGAAMSFALPSDEQYAPGAEGDRLFVGMLADAVAARDEGRVLTSKDVPSKPKTGHGPGAEFKAAVVRAGQPLVKPWKAPRIPSEGKPLTDDVLSGFADAEFVVAETEAAPGVWLPMAAVRVADLAGANGWTVAMERPAGGAVVIVRTAGVIERKGFDGATATVAGECVAVFEGGAYVQARSGALVGGRYLGGATLSQVLKTVGQTAQPGQLASVTVTPDRAPAPAGVSDPGGEDAWESEGGACVGVDGPEAQDAGWRAAPVDTDPSPEMGTCTTQAVAGIPVRPDAVSVPATVGSWDGEGGAVPGADAPRVDPGEEQDVADDEPFAVRPAVPEWRTVPDTDHENTELTCAGLQYRVSHAPDAPLPYTVRRTVGSTDADLGGWVGLDDVYAIVRADRRRMAALEAERRRVEQQQRRAAYRMLGQPRQASVRLTEEDRRAIARRAEKRHRPATAELYVSPITGTAVLAWVCGSCATTHDDPLWRAQTIGGSYRTPLSVERDTLVALVEKHGWTITGTWTAHGTRGDTMRAPIAPTPAYLAWVDATYGPDPAMPEVEPGETITRAQRGWWNVVSREGHRYELTWRPTLTGPVWSVRHRSGDGFETVARTGTAGAVLAGMRVHSAERSSEPEGAAA